METESLGAGASGLKSVWPEMGSVHTIDDALGDSAIINNLAERLTALEDQFAAIRLAADRLGGPLPDPMPASLRQIVDQWQKMAAELRQLREELRADMAAALDGRGADRQVPVIRFDLEGRVTQSGSILISEDPQSRLTERHER